MYRKYTFYPMESKVKKILLLLCCALSGGSWAAETECENAKGIKYAQCIKKALTKSESELNTAFKQAYSTTPLYSQKEFSVAQKAWLHYRKLECSYQISLNSTASDFPSDREVNEAQCTIELNNERIKQLNDI